MKRIWNDSSLMEIKKFAQIWINDMQESINLGYKTKIRLFLGTLISLEVHFPFKEYIDRRKSSDHLRPLRVFFHHTV